MSRPDSYDRTERAQLDPQGRPMVDVGRVAVGAESGVTPRDGDEPAELSAGIPRIGELVLGGKYRIERVLGLGGMGVVLAATHVTLGQTVALKFLLREVTEKRHDATERFLREARAVANIPSEHVVKVMDVGLLETGTPYMLMEYLVGRDLAAHLKERGPLPVVEAIGYALQTCEAVAAAHARGVVHRDLKPSNLFLTTRGDGTAILKVLDFGISKVQTPESDLQLSLTRPGTVLGSPMYMSPEQIRNSKHVDARADIWAIGMVIYELLTGAPMYEADTFSALCAAIASDPPVPVRAKRADVPEGIELALLRCLDKDPGKRFPNVADLADAIAPHGPEGSQLVVQRAARLLGVTTTGARRRPFTTSRPPSGGWPATTSGPNVAARGVSGSGSAQSMPELAVSHGAERRSRAPVIALGALGAILVLGAVAWRTTRGPATDAAGTTSAGAAPSALVTPVTAPVTPEVTASSAATPMLAPAPTLSGSAPPKRPLQGHAGGVKGRPAPPSSSAAASGKPAPAAPSDDDLLLNRH